MNVCKKKSLLKKVYDSKIQKEQNKNKLLNVELKFQKKETEYYKVEIEYYKNLLNQTGNMLKGSVSTLTYVMNNYKDAPVLEPIKGERLNELENDKIKLARLLIEKFKHNTLKSYIGDFIIKLHKTQNPNDQSLWNTDSNRLTFLVKEYLLDKTSKWMIDKDGRKTLECLIVPLLDESKKLLQEYFDKECIVLPNKTMDEYEYLIYEQNAISDLITNIDNGVIANDILKYISPPLNFKSIVKYIKK